MTRRAGVIGLGVIGGGIATALCARGHRPAGYDIRAAAGDALPGVDVLASARHVAEVADVVAIAVLDAPQVWSVLLGDDGVLAGARPGCVVAVMSTVAVSDIREMAQVAEDHSVEMIDVGVTGLPGAAAQGALVCLAGGAPEAVERASGVLHDCVASVRYLGPLGSGMAAKVALNAITYGTWRAVHEACSLAGAAGVDVDAFLAAVEAGDPSGRIRFVLAKSQSGPAGGATPERRASAERMETIMRKDLQAAQRLAVDLGVAVPLLDVAEQQVASTLGLGAHQ